MSFSSSSSSSHSHSHSSSSSHSHSHSHSSSISVYVPSPEPPVAPEPPTRCDDRNGCGDDTCSSGSAIQLKTGEVLYSETDLSGPLTGFVHARSYSNVLTETYSGQNGNNWLMPNSSPYLAEETAGNSDQLVYVNGQQRVWFDKNGSNYTARYGMEQRYKLVAGSNNTLVLSIITDQGIETTFFHDFSHLTQLKGLMVEHVDAYGCKTEVHGYGQLPNGDPGPWITELRRDEGGMTWSIKYDFYGTGAHTDRIEKATLRKRQGVGAWTDIQRASYSYYDGSNSNGSLNDLETVTIENKTSGSWVETRKTYYRYFKPGDSKGFAGALRYVVGPAAYAEMLADSITPETATNAQIEDYADRIYEYGSGSQSDPAVTKVTTTDCAGCSGGSGTGQNGETFVRTTSSHPDSFTKLENKNRLHQS